MSSTYTFEGLAAAAASSSSIAEAVRKLGREPSPKRNQYVMGPTRRVGIDTSHFPRTIRRLYTREMLQEAAEQSTSIVEVVRRLGAKEVGGTQAHIGRLLRRYEIDISHFESLRRRPRRRIEEVSAAEFADAVSQGAQYSAHVSRILGVGDTHAFRSRGIANASSDKGWTCRTSWGRRTSGDQQHPQATRGRDPDRRSDGPQTD